ncbi:YcxB family protein [Psychromonas antarctica]|jgi:hypothetical protein|uniref:YcxB family protein n=1 Tax=Psychromonas antarctica TaxID=67573 RepID=UPI001EE89A1F|nr:YcxB family protein [Psychromonas antarctica]MCG6201285.1 YcxB family protein [Psychromonas antarctica]
MHFESQFPLNRQHLEECYDQSLPFNKNSTPRFKFIALLVTSALLIFVFSKQLDVLAYFLIALALVEFMSFHYRRAWWLSRQIWSRNSGNTITLVIDDKGIKTQSLYNNSQLLWSDLLKVGETDLGLMLTFKSAKLYYLSKSNLNNVVCEFIKQQAH